MSSNLFNFLLEKGFHYDRNVINIIQFVLDNRDVNYIRAILLRGPPGTGKTELTRLVAEYLNAQYLFYQCVPGTSEDDLLYKYVPSERTTSGIEIVLGILPEALKLSHSRKVVLVLDEFDKARPTADAFLLDFIQNCRVSCRISNEEKIITGNPRNIILFLTSNDMRDLSEPLLRRVIHIKMRYLEPEKIRDILSRHFNNEKLIKLLVKIYEDTIRAGLEKPATVQELIQLGKAIEAKICNDLNLLLRTFIIKSDEDWERFIYYINNNETAENNENNDENGENIDNYYSEKLEKDEKHESTDIVKTAESRTLRLIWENESFNNYVKRNVKEEENNRIIEPENTLIIAKPNEEVYDSAIKLLEPQPQEAPILLFMKNVTRNSVEMTFNLLDVFKKWNDKNAYFESILKNCKEGLLVLDLSDIIKELVNIDLISYYKDIIEMAEKLKMNIIYYSKNLIRMRKTDDDNNVIDVAVMNNRVEIYFNNGKKCEDILDTLEVLRDKLNSMFIQHINNSVMIFKEYLVNIVEKMYNKIKIIEQCNKYYVNRFLESVNKWIDVLKNKGDSADVRFWANDVIDVNDEVVNSVKNIIIKIKELYEVYRIIDNIIDSRLEELKKRGVLNKGRVYGFTERLELY
ncbi:MAG: MoxR family ATPase [Crenarchaeota archaeon]|nr:MoxR family ATPase [Thermoproteota archaeon]